ncbi:MAG: response regulator transcription factor [Sphingobacteriales bacterium]|nr:MAG: response regulator transcription factor [Sphingobacteriales bacterium]
MKVLIIEDEIPAAERLQRLLLQQGNIEIAGVLNSVETTVAWLQQNPHPDVMFLDIHLADGLSFDIFNQVAVKCPVIFCTAYDQYALDAFQFNSIDYLLKPVTEEKLVKSLEKMNNIRESYIPTTDPLKMNDLVHLLKKKDAAYKSRFMVKMGSKIKTVKTDDIAYFYSTNKLTLLVTKDAENYPVDYALDELITMLDPVLFFHVNRKLIIHIDAATGIHPYFKGRLKLELHPPLEEEVIISNQKTPSFKDWLDQ